MMIFDYFKIPLFCKQIDIRIEVLNPDKDYKKYGKDIYLAVGVNGTE